MNLATASQNWTRARTVNQTSAAYVAKIPTATEPTGTGSTAINASVIDCQATLGGGGIKVMFFGIGADNTTFSCRIIGWQKTSDLSTLLWIPTVLYECDCIIDAVQTGVAGKDVLNTELFVDTITSVKALGTELVSTTSTGVPAFMAMGLSGAHKFEFSFTVGTATSANALFVLM